MVVLAIPLAIIWWPSCRRYPAVSSEQSLYLMKLLYTACNTRDSARLATVKQGVEKLCREGKMTPAEKECFDEIIGMAKAGRWQDAEQAAFKFAQDQVGRGYPNSDPAGHKHDHGPKGKN